MHKSFATMIVGAMLAAAQTQTQTQPTAAELLQKGIYAQETAGDLDGAIKIYHQIVDSHPAQREIAAQAQYRLGLTLLAKGDAAAASQEIQRLGWDFPDYKDLIASARSAGGDTIQLRVYRNSGPEMSQAFAADLKEAQAKWSGAVVVDDPARDVEFDFTRTSTVTGSVIQVQWLNPRAWLILTVPAVATPMRVRVTSPNALTIQGWKVDTVKVGEQVTVTGAPSRDGTSIMQATSVSANGVVLWSMSAMK